MTNYSDFAREAQAGAAARLEARRRASASAAAHKVAADQAIVDEKAARLAALIGGSLEQAKTQLSKAGLNVSIGGARSVGDPQWHAIHLQIGELTSTWSQLGASLIEPDAVQFNVQGQTGHVEKTSSYNDAPQVADEMIKAAVELYYEGALSETAFDDGATTFDGGTTTFSS